MQKLLKLADKADMRGKIDAMFNGEHINVTEDRAVLHTALRAPRKAVIEVDGVNVVTDVWKVLDRIKDFSTRVRSGEWTGITGKVLKNVVCIGIGGSYLGPLFVHTALATDQTAMSAAKGRVLRFLANVDPIDVAKALKGAHVLHPFCRGHFTQAPLCRPPSSSARGVPGSL
jgi:glucose-6-phosphate isomerase